MIRSLIWIAAGAALWAGAYLTPSSHGAWGVLRGLMLGSGAFMAGLNTRAVIEELIDRAKMRLFWWRNRRNGRLGRGYTPPDPMPMKIRDRSG